MEQQERDAPNAGLDRPMELDYPLGLPYTVYFPGDDGVLRGADLEHPAPVPRVGETVEYINERGECQRFVVREVIHTLQTSAASRPLVDAEPYAATSVPRQRDQRAEVPGDGGELRAGLPKVFLARPPAEPSHETAERGEAAGGAAMSDERPTTHPHPEPPQPPSVPTPNAPPLQRGEATGGGMTEETGILTPEVEQEELITGERREIEDPAHAGQAALKRHAAATGDSSAMGPGAPGSFAGPLATERASGLTGKMAEDSMGGSATPAAGTEAGSGRGPLGTYEGGYGSEHGLAPDDPAYREEPVDPENDPRRG